ncbi:hypothetical protein HED50_22980 [Ochrobactrum oryzae]|nr:hypothetical protein [Brucella oryzae]
MVNGFTFANFITFFSDAYYLKGMATTLIMAGLVTVVCILLSLPLANWMSRQRGNLKTLLLMAVILPLFISNAARCRLDGGFRTNRRAELLAVED